MSKRKIKSNEMSALKKRKLSWDLGLFWLKKCWMVLAILMILIALLFSLFRALTPWAKQYKVEIEQHLTTLVGQPVRIDSMETSWYWLQPVLKLNQVTVLDSPEHALKLDQLMVGINLLSSLWHWHLQPGILYIDDVHLSLRQMNGRWQIDGLRQGGGATALHPDVYLPVLSWLLTQQKIVLKNISASIHLQDGSVLPLSALNITAMNHQGHYRFKAEASFADPIDTEIVVLAELQLKADALQDISGHLYASVHHFSPQQWQVFLPKFNYQIKGGEGDFEVWADLKQGQVTNAQVKLDFQHVEWRKRHDIQDQIIQSVDANLAWAPTTDGWQLRGDHINLLQNNILWPENAFSINYQNGLHTYGIYVKNILLEPLLALPIDWPASVQTLLIAHPRGQLEDTQVVMQEGQLNKILTRFINLSWRKQENMPAFNHLSGVLNWQPQEGRLDFNGENTTLSPPKEPSVTFTQINGAFEWRELSDGLRVSMDHLVLIHPQLVLSARGVLDEALSPSRKLRLTAEFSAQNATRWLTYIPSQHLNPKFDHWLKHDIKKVDKASGQLNVNGALADFPFDNTMGEFNMITHVSGMDLFFYKKWPSVDDIDLFLRLDKRTLDINVSHALLKEMESTAAHIHIDDLGLGKEMFLLHGQAEVPGYQLKDYLLSTPLKSHLGKLKKLDIKGPVDLDLNIQFALYPTDKDLWVRGGIKLADNQAIFHHALKDISFMHLTGVLAFDEKGVIDSQLNANLLGDPVAMHIQSVRDASPYTEISIIGDTTIDILREKFDLPIFSFMDGPLTLTSKIKLTDDPNDLDNMTVNTSLAGVSIDLPKPLGKSAAVDASLNLNVDFNPDTGVRLRFNYDNRLSSDLWFENNKDSLRLEKGTLLVGKGQAMMQNTPGVKLMGNLPTFDVQQWQKVWDGLSFRSRNKKLIDRFSVDMNFGTAFLWGKKYDKVALKANQLSSDEWAFNIQQKEIAGDINYQLSTHTLSGHLSRLHMAKPTLANTSIDPTLTRLKPSRIPNLNLMIDELQLGDINVGGMTLKSTSTPHLWHLDSCKIQSPNYLLTMKGDWTVQDGKNRSTLEANLQIDNLEQGLTRWHIIPAVEARKGSVQLIGGWPGGMHEYSLTKMEGTVQMSFQNGRITHLSPETEEKLGLGKLLSILSLQTLPRRLKLDFSDLNSGYSFDTFKGDFTLKKGVLTTTNSYIDGPVAYASMKGDLDVVKQLYDIDLHISPHVTASLPIVATIAGGPLAGMAAWVASKIINQSMQQVSGYTYKISGPWFNPVVQQLNIYRKNLN